MNMGDKVKVNEPAWLADSIGTIKNILATEGVNGYNYYVVEFDNGEMYTYQEYELKKEKSNE